MSYDGADRQVKVTDAQGNFVENGFDGAGNLVSAKRTEECTIWALGPPRRSPRPCFTIA